MSGTTVDPGALRRVAGDVEAIAQEINSTVGIAHGIAGSGGTAGREYTAKGDAYAAVAFPRMQQLIQDYWDAVDDLADKIEDSAANYETVEAANTDNLSGAGVALNGIGGGA